MFAAWLTDKSFWDADFRGFFAKKTEISVHQRESASNFLFLEQIWSFVSQPSLPL